MSLEMLPTSSAVSNTRHFKNNQVADRLRSFSRSIWIGRVANLIEIEWLEVIQGYWKWYR